MADSEVEVIGGRRFGMTKTIVTPPWPPWRMRGTMGSIMGPSRRWTCPLWGEGDSVGRHCGVWEGELGLQKVEVRLGG